MASFPAGCHSVFFFFFLISELLQPIRFTVGILLDLKMVNLGNKQLD